MADTSEGYQCEFVDSVPDHLYCKKCTQVARRLNSTSCCRQSFCLTCIADTQEQGQPCPVCGEKEFTVIKHVQHQEEINHLQVYCSTKERGCDWSGTLDQLDTHLDPHLDNCQYVDTKCPRNCLQTIPKNKVDHHVAQECTKRPHVCQHCGFKATYEELVDTHLPECSYVSLQRPSVDGDGQFIREDQDEHDRQNSQKHLTLTASLAVETKEQLQQKSPEQDIRQHEVTEDSIHICHLEEVESEFSSVGCDSWSVRDAQDEYDRQNSQKYLTSITGSLTTEIQQSFEEQKKTFTQQKIQLDEQRIKMHEQEVKLKKLGEQEEKLLEQEMIIKKKNKEITELKQAYNQLEATLQNMKITSKETEQRISNLLNMLLLNRRFEMESFSVEKAKATSLEWKSPAMYTHVWGYKFCIGVDANGRGIRRGNSVGMSFWSMAGEFDNQLKWPVKTTITVEVINKRGQADISVSETCSWNKPITSCEFVKYWYSLGSKLSHSQMYLFLLNDTLRFHVSDIEI